MKAIQFIYNDQQVDFQPGGNENVMVNATQMAKIFGKRVDHFLRSDHAQAFIEALLSTPYGGNKNEIMTPNGLNKSEIMTPYGGNKPSELTPYGGSSRLLKREEILITNRKGGTWMHRILALKFAAWLDPYFEVWIFHTLDSIILGHYKEVDQATYEKMQAEKEFQQKKEELIKSNPEVAELFELESIISAADKKRIKALKEKMKQLKIDFEYSN